MQKLITFITPSRRLDNIRGLFDNIENTVSDPSCVEVLVKFDDDQEGVSEFIESEVKKRPFDIRYIITPRLEGIYSVWVAMEQLYFMANPASYFIQIISDEPRFTTHHWDKVLRKYIGYYKDDVFRLRLSTMKVANYSSHYECTFRPDSFPIYTKRWLELTEGTGDCWGSDAYQQCVAFQLSMGPGSYFNFYRHHGLSRDIVVNDIELAGLEFCVGVGRVEQKERHKRNLREWARLSTHEMQEKFSYLARRINCYVWARERNIQKFKLTKHPFLRTVSVDDVRGNELYSMSYAVPLSVVLAQNAIRRVVMFPRHMIIFHLETLSGYIPYSFRAKIKRLFLRLSKSRNANINANTGEDAVNTVQDANEPLHLVRRTIFMLSALMYIPLHLIILSSRKLLKSWSPGISSLYSKNPNIPQGIQPPTAQHVNWLESELSLQNEKKSELGSKIFMLKGCS